jgi:3-oxoadipate enol-lactonase
MEAVASGVVERWLTPAFRHSAPEVAARARAWLVRTPAEGYASCCAAVRDADERGTLAAIRAATLVIAGAHDPATPPEDGRRLASSIPRARYVELPASHLSNLEAEDAFTSELLGFVSGGQGA